jgi:hypothetical protein
MPFNEKALTRLNRQRRQQQGGSFDAIDAEAERQGNACRFFKTNEIGPKILGKRISKETRQADGNAKTADARATRNLVHDTAQIAKSIMVPQLTLRQN